MFKETTDHTHNLDVVADALQLGPQAAHATHHQLDHDAGLRGLVEQGDDRRIHQGIHLCSDMAAPAGLGMLDFAADQAFHAAAQRHWSHQ